MTMFYVPPGAHVVPGNLSLLDGSWEAAMRATFRTLDEELLGNDKHPSKGLYTDADSKESRMDWQPIETAPEPTWRKPILIWIPDSPRGFHAIARSLYGPNGLGSATHWMPLPEPPTLATPPQEPGA